MKFKVGDIVKIVDFDGYGFILPYSIGDIGKIIKIVKTHVRKYNIDVKCWQYHKHSQFSKSELSLVTQQDRLNYLYGGIDEV